MNPAKDHELERTQEREAHLQFNTEAGYRSVRDRLTQIRQTELLQAKRARKRAGILASACLYDRKHQEIDPAFAAAMQRLWDIGSLDAVGRADTDLRRLYHLIAKGYAPLSDADVVKLGTIPEADLRLIIPWLAQQMGVAEAQDHVDLGEIASPVIETTHESKS